MRLRVLVACEESQAVSLAFRQLGHDAFSCDLKPCSGGHPEWHIQGDVVPVLYGDWDIIIAHPPCTYLSKAGSCRLNPGGVLNQERMAQARSAADFFNLFLDLPCPHVAVENPVPGRIHNLPHWDQIIEPYYFGDPFTKKTCLWLRGLPPLMSTVLVYDDLASWVGAHRSAAVRSKTFPGIAQAMARQWGDFVASRRSCAG